MNLDVLKSTVHFSKWRDFPSIISISFDVAPKESEYIEIGDNYIFSSSRYYNFRNKERQLIDASVHISTESEVLENIQPFLPGEEGAICGWAAFYPARHDDLDPDPAKLNFNVVVEPDVFAELLRTNQRHPGGTTLGLSIEGLEYGWEPDGSHLIWKVDEAREKRAISSFSYQVENFWTSERAIQDESDRQSNAALADSPDPEAQKLARIIASEDEPDPITVLLKQCRALLVAIILLGIAVLFK